jgi:hypothetical protein
MRIESHYLPPVAFFALALRHRSVVLEQHEHYQKGSWRNRCLIGAANGPLRLTVPLLAGKNEQLPIREVRIANDDHDWQRLHWESIRSAYGRAPYFAYYGDALAPFFFKKYTFLFDLNLELTETLLQCCRLPVALECSASYDGCAPESDFRHALSPKHDVLPQGIQTVAYPQPFEDRHGFLPGLSIVDLLFSAGPRSEEYLGKMFAAPPPPK